MTRLTLGSRLPPPAPERQQTLPAAEPATVAAIQALMLRRTRIKSGPPREPWTGNRSGSPGGRE